MTRKQDSLQVLRCLAASLVVAAHAGERVVNLSAHPDGSALGATRALGLLGVCTFFVISGYIMVLTSGRQAGSTAGALEFARRRIVRVVPLYWIATAVTLALQVRHPSNDATFDHITKSLLFVPYFSQMQGGHMRPVLGQGWTLDYEMFFYALFAACLLLPRRMGLIASIGLLVGLAALHPFVSGAVLQTWTDSLLLLFGAGMVLGVASTTYPQALPRLSHPLAVSVACLVVGALAGFVVRPGPTFGVVEFLAFGPLAVASVAVCVLTAEHRSSTWAAPFVAAGDASYSTYLWHQLFLFGAQRAAMAAFHHHLDLWTFAIPAVILANVFGWGLFVLVERPVTAWLNRVTAPEPQPVTATA